MKLEPPFRAARRGDCRRIAELFSISSGGVANYVWSTLDDSGLPALEVGARRYAAEDTDFSYRNCVVVELDGEVVGMMISYPMEGDSAQPPPAEGAAAEGRAAPEPAPDADVLAPYRELEAPGTFYICGMALMPAYRGRGLGTRLLAIAEERARERGLDTLSLIAFAENSGAVKLYERHGFKVIARRAVVPHRLIRYTGEVLLMTAEL